MLRRSPLTDDGNPCAVVGNLPCVPPEKKEKLEAIVLKIYSQIGAIKKGASWATGSQYQASSVSGLQIRHLPCRHPDGLFMPMDAKTNLSKGFAFVEFATPQEAQAARTQTNGACMPPPCMQA